MEENEITLYEYEHNGSMLKSMIGKIVTGTIFAYCMLVFPNLFFKLICGFVAFSMLAPMIVDFTRNQIKSLRVTSKTIEIAAGFAGYRQISIPIFDIKKIEVLEKNERRSRNDRRKKGENSKVIFKKGRDYENYSENARCLITLNNGKQFEIEKKFFIDAEFENFMMTMEKVYDEDAKFIAPKAEKEKKLIIQNSPQEQKIDKLIARNKVYLDEDNALKAKFLDKLNEAYRAIYCLRTTKEAINMKEFNVIHSLADLGKDTFYIFDNDFLPQLSPENVEIGLHLIDTAKKNLKLVETRINYYYQIDEKLQNLKFQEESRRKLQNITKDLQKLQNKNTQNAINIDLNTEESSNYVNQLEELEDLTQTVHNLEDLEKAVELNEHITIFKNEQKL